MKRALTAAVIGVFVLTAWSVYLTARPAAVADEKGIEQIITELERAWVRAIVNKDIATIERLMAPDFSGTSPTAHTYFKEMAIADLKSGLYVVDKMDLDEISVNVFGNTAVAFTSQEEKSRYVDIDLSGHYHYTDVWVKRNGQWQVVASHGSRFDKPTAKELPLSEVPFGEGQFDFLPH